MRVLLWRDIFCNTIKAFFILTILWNVQLPKQTFKPMDKTILHVPIVRTFFICTYIKYVFASELLRPILNDYDKILHEKNVIYRHKSLR